MAPTEMAKAAAQVPSSGGVPTIAYSRHQRTCNQVLDAELSAGAATIQLTEGDLQMFDAQYLFDDAVVWSPWFPRQGDNIRIVGELIKKNTANIDVTLWHKEAEAAGNGDQVTGTLTLSSEGTVVAKEYEGLKDLVRYKFTATGTTAAHYALFRMLSPVWFDSVS